MLQAHLFGRRSLVSHRKFFIMLAKGGCSWYKEYVNGKTQSVLSLDKVGSLLM